MYVRRRWKQVQYMSDLFWKRWVKEYLPQLQEHQRWSGVKRNLIPGDIVLIVDNTAPRKSWVMGRVLQTFPDRRGFVRQVLLEFSPSSAVPGEESILKLTAHPDSLCGVSAVDQSVLIKEPGKTLNVDK
eukprot:superscaffoldBa00011876_g25416